MDFHQHFDGPDDMQAHLDLTYERVMPLLDWLDDLTDPERHKVKAALVILLVYDRVRHDRIPKETMLRNFHILYDAIADGELDNVVPFPRK